MVHALCISFSLLSVLMGMRVQTGMYRYLTIYHKHHLGFGLRIQMSSLLLQDHFLVFEYSLSLIGVRVHVVMLRAIAARRPHVRPLFAVCVCV